jgi:ATP-dependent Lon protease
MVGVVNGLWASNSGMGGITVIQVIRINSDKKFSLEKLTGNQGDIMKESMTCAMSLAWNIIPEDTRKNINESKEGYGLHIHCPDAETPKDGPSAGITITLAIVSRILNIAIHNDIAMTAEIDLLGNALPIGGLHSKLIGAYNAGIKKVLICRENKKDLEIIFRKEKKEFKNILSITKSSENLKDLINEYNNEDEIMFRNTIKIVIIDNIYDVLKHGLVKNNIEFNKIN